MSPVQISRHLTKFGVVTTRLANLAAFKHAALVTAQQLPVRWTFDPATPASVVDYLAGGVTGALEGGAVGYGIGLLLTVLFPPVAIGYLTIAGAAWGATRRLNQVGQGWRIRLLHDAFGEPMIEVRRIS
jgi:hypothetical protein